MSDYQLAKHRIQTARIDLLAARLQLATARRFIGDGNIDLTELDEVIEQLDGLLGRLVLVDSGDEQ